MKTLKKIEIVKWFVHVYETDNQKQMGELIGVDANGDEYTTESQVYIHGQYHEVEDSIICTDGKKGALNPDIEIV